MKFKNIPLSEKQTKASKAHMGVSVGDKNGMWKGDMVGYGQIHKRMAKKIIKGCICPKCKKRPPEDLHNLDGKYTSKPEDWVYLCRSCHCKEHRGGFPLFGKKLWIWRKGGGVS